MLVVVGLSDGFPLCKLVGENVGTYEGMYVGLVDGTIVVLRVGVLVGCKIIEGDIG